MDPSLSPPVNPFLDRLLPPAPPDDAEAYHRGSLLVAACLLTALFSAGYVLLDLYSGFEAGAVVMGTAAVVFAGLPVLLRPERTGAAVVHLFLLVGTATVVLNTYFSGAGAIPPWLAVVPLAATLLAGSRAGWAWTFVAVGLTVSLGPLVGDGRPSASAVDPGRQTVWLLAVRTGLPMIVFLLALAFQREKERAFRALRLRNVVLEDALAELGQAQARLVQQEKLASLGQLTAGIAHEIKNPLNFVTNFASLSEELAGELRTALRDDDGPAAETLLDEIEANVRRVITHGRRADGIVRAMSAHARKEHGVREAVDLNALVAEQVVRVACTRDARPSDTAVTIEVAYDEGVGAVEVVREEVGRALHNLLDNAFYASRSAPPGPAGPRVRVETARRDGHVEVRIRDNGPGIPEEVRERILEPFFTTKPAGEGVGLGLSLAHEIVTARHGGALAVESAVGAGTTLVVTLPAPGPSPPASLHPSNPAHVAPVASLN